MHRGASVVPRQCIIVRFLACKLTSNVAAGKKPDGRSISMRVLGIETRIRFWDLLSFENSALT